MRRMRERYAERNANGGMLVRRRRGCMNALVRRFGSGQAERDAEAGGDGQGHGQARGVSFPELTNVAPTQEEEDEEWRNMSLCKLLPW